MEPLQLSLGFNPDMQKADTIQYIAPYKTLNVLLSYEDALSKVHKTSEHIMMGVLLNLVLC